MTAPVVVTYHELYDGRGFSRVRQSWSRYRLARELFRVSGLTDCGLRFVRPELATEQELLLVHTPEHVAFVRDADARGTGYLDYGDTPAYPGVYRRALAAVGGTVLGARLIGDGLVAHAFNPGGGLHHAYADEAGGFCPFNDVVIAIRVLQREYGFRRIAVLDLDGHHGDGTQALLYDEPTLYVSMHRFGERFYPGTGGADEIGIGPGRGYTLNVPLPAGIRDAEYLQILDDVALPRVRDYEPDFLIVQIGVDTHYADPLVRLGLTTAAYRAIGNRVHDLAHAVCGGRLLAVAGGGYVPVNVARSWAVFVGTVGEAFRGDDDPLLCALAAEHPLPVTLAP